MATDVNATLDERGKRYGSFAGHAKATQGLKRTFQSFPNWHAMNDSQREALEMIAHKIGRILNGDPSYADSWHDIAGYASLVDQELASGTAAEPEPVSRPLEPLPQYQPPSPQPAPQPQAAPSPSTGSTPPPAPTSRPAAMPAPKPVGSGSSLPPPQPVAGGQAR